MPRLALLGLLIAAGFTRPILSSDLWMHLRMGQDIVREGKVPDRDAYSFTAPGAPFVDQEWGSQVLFFLGWKAVGLDGLALGAALGVALTFVLLLTHKKGDPAVDLGILLLLLPLADAHFSPRPHVLGWLLIPILHRVLTGPPWGVLLLLVLWANLHASFILAVGFSGLHFLERRRLGWAALSALAPLLNPRGIHLYGFFHGLKGIPVEALAEFKPFAPGSLGFTLWAAFSFLVVAGLLKGRPAGAGDWIRVLVFVPLGFSALRYPVVSGLFLAPMLSRLWSPWVPRVRLLVPALSVLLLAGFLYAVRAEKAARLGVDAHALPVAATAFLERHGVPGPLFNDYNFGAYLLWNAPSRRVFADGRMDVYRGEPIRDAFAIAKAEEGWEERAARWGIRCFFVPKRRPVADRLLDHPGWDLAYYDSNAAIFVPKGTGVPVLRNATFKGPRNPGDLASLEADLRFLVAESPGNFDAHGNLAQVLRLKGDREGAEREAALWQRHKP